jgi:hypothetical protein
MESGDPLGQGISAEEVQIILRDKKIGASPPFVGSARFLLFKINNKNNKRRAP